MIRALPTLAALAMATGLSTVSWAGGGGPHGAAPMMVHPSGGMHGGGHRGGWNGHATGGGGHMQVSGGGWNGGGGHSVMYGHTQTSLRNGVAHRYIGQGFDQGRSDFGYGHVATGLRYSYGARRYGHVTTGIERSRPNRHYAVQRRGYGGAGYAYAAGGYDGNYGYAGEPSGYGGSSNPASIGGSEAGGYGTTQTGYGGASQGQGYAEQPLNAIGYGGGPQILVVHGDRPTGLSCTCRTTSPVVYRYGVGSYY